MLKNVKKITIFAIVVTMVGFGFGELVNAASQSSIYASFSNTGKPVLAGVNPSRSYPYLYTESQLYDAQFSITLGNDEASSQYRSTVVGGTVMITELGVLYTSNGPVGPIKLYMKNKSATALNIYSGTFFY